MDPFGTQSIIFSLFQIVVQKNRKSPKAGKAAAKSSARTPTKAALKSTPKSAPRSAGRVAKAPPRYRDDVGCLDSISNAATKFRPEGFEFEACLSILYH